MPDNPALVPESAQPSERRYTAGPRRVLGHQPGETFTAVLPLKQEARLLASGAITFADPLEKKSRDDLNVIAAELGVQAPEDLQNKEAVIAEIAAATTEKEA